MAQRVWAPSKVVGTKPDTAKSRHSKVDHVVPGGDNVGLIKSTKVPFGVPRLSAGGVEFFEPCHHQDTVYTFENHCLFEGAQIL